MSGFCRPFSTIALRAGSLVSLAAVLLFCLAGGLYAAEKSAEELRFTSFESMDASTRSLVDGIVRSLGGAERIRGISSLKKRAWLEEVAGETRVQLQMDALAVPPRTFHARITLPDAEVTATSIDGAAHIVRSDSPIPGAAIKLDSRETRTLLEFFHEQPLLVLRNRQETGFLVAPAGTATIGGRELDVLAVTEDSREIRWYVERVTRRVVRTAFDDCVVDLSDWRTTGGLSLPFREKRTCGDGESSDVRIAGYEINAPVDMASLSTPPRVWMTRHPLYRPPVETYPRYSWYAYVVFYVYGY